MTAWPFFSRASFAGFRLFRFSAPLVIMLLYCPPGSSAELSLGEVTKLLDSATKTIESFDVYATSSTVYHLVAEPGPNDTIRYVPAPSGLGTKNLYRQIASADGRRRIESLASNATEELIAVQVLDGEVEFVFLPKQSSGSLRIPRAIMIPVEEDYLCCFRDAIAMDSFVSLIRDRSTVTVKRDHDRTALIVLDAPPDPKATFLKRLGFRLWLDPDRGCLPIIIEHYQVHPSLGEQVMSRRIVEHTEMEPDMWVPIRSKYTTFARQGPLRGRITREVELVLDMSRSTWNHPTIEKEFEIQYPEGTYISDMIRGIGFYVGQTSPSSNVEALISHARNIATVSEAATVVRNAESPRRWAILIGLNAFAIMVGSIAWIAYRKREQS